MHKVVSDCSRSFICRSDKDDELLMLSVTERSSSAEGAPITNLGFFFDIICDPGSVVLRRFDIENGGVKQDRGITVDPICILCRSYCLMKKGTSLIT